jgi:hypothetical protein
MLKWTKTPILPIFHVQNQREITPCKKLLLSTKQGHYIFEVGAECL